MKTQTVKASYLKSAMEVVSKGEIFPIIDVRWCGDIRLYFAGGVVYTNRDADFVIKMK